MLNTSTDKIQSLETMLQKKTLTIAFLCTIMLFTGASTYMSYKARSVLDRIRKNKVETWYDPSSYA